MKSLRILSLIVALSVGSQASAATWFDSVKSFFGGLFNSEVCSFVKDNAVAVGAVATAVGVSVLAIFKHRQIKAQLDQQTKTYKEALDAKEAEKQTAATDNEEVLKKKDGEIETRGIENTRLFSLLVKKEEEKIEATNGKGGEGADLYKKLVTAVVDEAYAATGKAAAYAAKLTEVATANVNLQLKPAHVE